MIPGFFSANQSTPAGILQTSLNVASGVVGDQALRAMQSAVAAASPAALSVSMNLPAPAIAVAPAIPSEGEPAAAAAPELPRAVLFTPSFMGSFPTTATSQRSNADVTPGPSKEIAALALLYDHDSFFDVARNRNALVFKLTVVITVILAGLGLIGICGCLFTALYSQKALWSVALGGIGLANWLGLLVFKPLDRILSALAASTRLDLLVFRLRHQLDNCMKYPTLEAQHECQTKVWDSIQHDPMLFGPQSVKQP